jgi:hypothetical protein
MHTPAVLQGVCILQTLDDAEALLFLEKNFGELLNRMPPDEVAATCKRQLSRLSQVRVCECVCADGCGDCMCTLRLRVCV